MGHARALRQAGPVLLHTGMPNPSMRTWLQGDGNMVEGSEVSDDATMVMLESPDIISATHSVAGC